jgi:hypothetical protein
MAQGLGVGRVNMSRHAAFVLVLMYLGWTLALWGCGGSNEPAPSEPPAKGSAPIVEPTPEPPPPPPERKPYVPDPSGMGDACSDTSPCGWDHPCVPTRCVGQEHIGTSPACEERAPEPGECTCLAGHCTLRPNAPASEPVSCKLTGSCGLDQGAGRCVDGAMQDANRGTRDHGPACHCNFESSTCEFVWVEPIECESVEQCWVSDSSPYHPIPRPKALRGKKFRPCKDGEVAPLCTNGRCTVAAYSC